MTYRIYCKSNANEYYGIQVNDNEQIVHAVVLTREEVMPPIIQEDKIRELIGQATYGITRSLGISLQSEREWH